MNTAIASVEHVPPTVSASPAPELPAAEVPSVDGVPPVVHLATVADVDIVVVAYRSADLIGACLSSVAAGCRGLRVTTTVVDNAADGSTRSLLEADFPAVTVVELARNTGFAYASNLGLNVGSARYVLLLNPDAVVTPDAVTTLVKFADSHPSAGVIAPALRFPDGRPQLTARRFPQPSAALFGRRSPLTRAFPRNRWSTRFLSGRDHAGPHPFRCDWVSGAAMLVPRRVIDRVGGLDEGFFLFWEDADWCHRIVDAGYEVWTVPGSRVVHDEGGTRDHGWNVATLRAFHRGAYRYWVKHHAPQPWNPWRWVAGALLTVRALVLAVSTGVRRRLS